MSAVEFEASPCIVIKIPEFPVSYVVAVLALCTQPALVHIDGLVAGVAGRGCFVLV
jgi:hypothetical protein